MSAVGLYGAAIEVGHGYAGGWTMLGPERVVTRSEGNELLELDGRPALQLYKDYLGERACGLPGTALLFPLGTRAEGQPDNSERELIRTVLSVNESRQSMTFTDDVPQGLGAAHAGLGSTCSLVGFYSYGELAPVRGGDCVLHNMTMAITVLRERPE